MRMRVATDDVLEETNFGFAVCYNRNREERAGENICRRYSEICNSPFGGS